LFLIDYLSPFVLAYFVHNTGLPLKNPLIDFIQNHQQILVLTGAGVSTASGIPDYRDEKGQWKHRKPIYFDEFIESETVRQRYWARSAVGWQRFGMAKPGRAHLALAQLESEHKVSTLITQNVDNLHQRAGSLNVIDLHGNLQQVICLGCKGLRPRSDIQDFLFQHNPQLKDISAYSAPDGDAYLEGIDFSSIQIPFCEQCGGMLKPDVVFYGESVPTERVKRCYAAVDQSDAMLVVGSSLMVYSSYRFVLRAVELGLEIIAINRGLTRADDLLNMKIEQDCGEALDAVYLSYK
jgi:NAD-dependent SIR2 family protein deacetylase